MNWFGIAFVLLMMCAPFVAYWHEKKTVNAQTKKAKGTHEKTARHAA